MTPEQDYALDRLASLLRELAEFPRLFVDQPGLLSEDERRVCSLAAEIVADGGL